MVRPVEFRLAGVTREIKRSRLWLVRILAVVGILNGINVAAGQSTGYTVGVFIGIFAVVALLYSSLSTASVEETQPNAA